MLNHFYAWQSGPEGKIALRKHKGKPDARDSKKGVRWPSSAARLKAWVSFAYAHGEPRVDK